MNKYKGLNVPEVSRLPDTAEDRMDNMCRKAREQFLDDCGRCNKCVFNTLEVFKEWEKEEEER